MLRTMVEARCGPCPSRLTVVLIHPGLGCPLRIIKLIVCYCSSEWELLFAVRCECRRDRLGDTSQPSIGHGSVNDGTSNIYLLILTLGRRATHPLIV